MDNNRNNKIVKYRKPLNINIGMVIFAVIFIYIIICVFMYFTQKHVEGHQVKMGSLSSNNIYKGIALRDEVIVNAAQAGYVNYYAREGERVGVGNLVYTLDQSGRLADYMNAENTGTTLSNNDLTEIKTEILGFVNNFEPQYFNSVYDFKYNVKGTVLKLANAGILENIDKINGAGLSELVSFCEAPTTGILIYSVDGYEDLTLEQFTKDLFDTKNYEKNQLISNELVEVGQPVYKVSTNEDWSIVIQTDYEKAQELVEAEFVKVKFLKNQDTSWGEVSTYTNVEGDIFVKLTFTNSMVTFCTDRFIDIELILEEETGLKIPNSSIAEKEFFIVPKEFVETTIYNETETEYYLDDMILRIGDDIIKPGSSEKYTLSKRGSLQGVYNINKGYADFKQINILYQNEEYSIVKSNTQYGLNVYDYIVLDATTVQDDELIYE